MLKKVVVGQRQFSDYKGLIDKKLYADVLKLAKKFKGKKILHINATPAGGGVAEILHSEIPILKGLGIKAEWQVLAASQEFFGITKMIHNGLQGDPSVLTLGQWDIYQQYNRELSSYINAAKWDYIIIHDPQPAAVLSYCAEHSHAKWVWRCHIDSRHATPNFIEHFKAYLKYYDGLIYTLKKYMIPGLIQPKLAIIPVAIDPLAVNNLTLDEETVKRLVAGFKIDINKPLVVQVSRFDPWKDPLGVVEAWQKAKKVIPELQLALVGQASIDDPESVVILDQVYKAVYGKKDVYVIPNRATDREVRAFQQHAGVVIQKSLREGFGLTVSEALWAGTPVIGGKVGGIREQIQNGKSGYLVESIDETAKHIIELVKNPAKASTMGEYGRRYVKRHFLLPRLIRDELEFLLSL